MYRLAGQTAAQWESVTAGGYSQRITWLFKRESSRAVHRDKVYRSLARLRGEYSEQRAARTLVRRVSSEKREVKTKSLLWLKRGRRCSELRAAFCPFLPVLLPFYLWRSEDLETDNRPPQKDYYHYYYYTTADAMQRAGIV